MADRVVLPVTVIFGSLFALQNNPLWLILCGFFITVQRPADLQLPLLSIRDLPDPHPRPRRRFLLLLQPAVDGVQQHHYRHYLAVRRLAGGDRVYRRQHADRDAGDRVVRPENARHRSGKHLTFCAGGDAGLFSKNSRSCENYSVITAFAPAVLLPGTKSNSIPSGEHVMSILTAPDGARIFYKDWGRGQPILFSHGWRCPPTHGTTSCCFRPERVPGDRPRSPRHGRSDQTRTVTTLTNTPTIWLC